jgi:predicted enzyme related to lactoylglutathione lyase
MFSKSGFATIIPVKDVDRAVKFYTEALGGKLSFRGQGEMKDSWASVKLAGEEFWLTVPDGRERRSLAYSVFLVRDVKAVVRELKGRGVKFERAEKAGKDTRIEGPITFESFGAMAFFKDSEGNLLMVWQNSPPA